MTDLAAGRPVHLDGLYDVRIGQNGDPGRAGITRVVRATLEVGDLTGGSAPAPRLLDHIEPYRPDHVVSTHDLRTVAVPEGFDFAADSMPKADPAVLRYIANYWFEYLGPHLRKIG